MSFYASNTYAAAQESREERNNVPTNFLWESIIADLHWSVLHIAALSILSNTLFHRKAAWTLRPWRHLLSDNSKIMLLALRYGADIGMADDIEHRLSKFYDDLSVAKTSTIPLVRSLTSYTNVEMQLVSQCASRWRRMSQDALQIVRDLESDVKKRLPVQYHEDSRTLSLFLKEAVGGESARVGLSGEILLPVLCQRRLTPRAAVQRSCRLILGSGSVAAKLVDISSRGLGVICKHPFMQGEKLSVELDNDRVLRASVVRRDGDHVGLLLETPLGSVDPLFAPPGTVDTQR